MRLDPPSHFLSFVFSLFSFLFSRPLFALVVSDAWSALASLGLITGLGA